jgi:hypothetical protein
MIHWLNTNANPRLPGWTEHHGWKMHAVEAPADAKLEDVKRSRALCGQRARYGWYVDLFMIEDWSQCYCERCKKIYDRRIAGNWVAS